MATDTAVSRPSTAFKPVIESNSFAVDELDLHPNSRIVRDERSSSLSEIGDRPDHEEQEYSVQEYGDANDTEAETERLEDSPHKQRKYQNVILTSANRVYATDKRLHPMMPADLRVPALTDPHNDGETLERSSEISSLADSGDEEVNAPSTGPSSPRKRKRSSTEIGLLSDDEQVAGPSKRAETMLANVAGGSPMALNNDISQGASANEDDQDGNPVWVVQAGHESPRPKTSRPASAKQTYKKGKRKGKILQDEKSQMIEDRATSAGPLVEPIRGRDALDSNGEEAELENGHEDEPEPDANTKTEEGLIHKKTALDSLNALEKCFTTLRDKVFDERLAQCNEELAMLERPAPTHQELLAMRAAVDLRRDKKLNYEDTLMKFKLQSLTRTSVANKAQALSQYAQTVRDLRDVHLEEINKKMLQLPRERRSREGEAPDFSYSYTTKRSQQVTQQIAYNTEVSVLSGVAKHVGFPAAPMMVQARPSEIQDDLRSMGIPLARPPTLNNHFPAFRAGLSVAQSYSRQNSAPEDSNFEQQAWANPLSHPRHPSHYRQQLHRHVSAVSRVATPSATPAGQRNLVDLTDLQGSASTVAEALSETSSSLVAKPITVEAAKFRGVDQNSLVGEIMTDYTPSKSFGATRIATPSNVTQPDGQSKSESCKTDRDNSPVLARKTSQESSSLPKPLPFMHTGSSVSTGANRDSTPNRYTMIKSEASGPPLRHSPQPHQFPTSGAVNAVTNGPGNRFTA